MTQPVSYVALLRGINVGGNVLIKMDALKKAFVSLKFKNVKTILASGNVLFDAPEANAEKVRAAIASKLKKTFGRDIGVIVRSMDEINALIASEPFKKIAVDKNTRLYVTFLSEEPKHSIKIPYVTADNSYKILSVENGHVCSVLQLTPKLNTTKVMNILEKEFGKNVTTRNWNTVLKFAKTQAKA